MSDHSPSADEKRLAQLREAFGGGASGITLASDVTFLLRLLDASQARLAEVERDAQTYKNSHDAYWSVRTSLGLTEGQGVWTHAIEPMRAEIALLKHDARAAEERASALAAALKLLVDDVADYPAWQRPCHALDVAREALSQAAVSASLGPDSEKS